MLLSVQQKYILEVLRKLGSIHRRQLAVLVREKFRRPDLEISDARLDAMLRQLRAGTSYVFIDGDMIRLSGAQPVLLRSKAIDVMLELAEGEPEDFTVKVERPELLCFSWGKNQRLFTVAELTAPIRPTMEALAGRSRVVWISDSGIVPEGLTLPPKHFFAARLPDGSHRFYGSNGP